MKQIFLTALMLMLFSSGGLAQNESFESVEAFLKSALKSNDRLFDEVKGDLNGDGFEDWAGMIEREKTEIAENAQTSTFKTSQIYILFGQNQRGYRLAAKSKEEKYSEGNGALYEGMEIKNSSLYLTLGNKTYGTHEVTTYQFKLDKANWRLIGVRVFYLVLESDKTIETDMNLLTGAIIEKRQTGERKPSVKRRYKKFPVYLFKDFDFYLEDFHFDYDK